MKKPDVRPSILAGIWYPEQPQALSQQVDDYLSKATLDSWEGEVVGLVCPHAGYRYSGPVAGHAFRAVQGQSYQTVVILSPYHRTHYYPMLTTTHSAYQTPLGEITIDQKNLDALQAKLKEKGVQTIETIDNDQEHAIEIELPFLQRALTGDFKLIPLMLSGTGAELAIQLGEALGEVFQEKNVLLVASTDLSHYYTEQTANQLDHAILDAVGSFQVKDVLRVYRSGKGEACGVMALLAAMAATRKLGAKHAKILQYATSGAASGDYSNVVGYGAGVFIR